MRRTTYQQLIRVAHCDERSTVMGDGVFYPCFAIALWDKACKLIKEYEQEVRQSPVYGMMELLTNTTLTPGLFTAYRNLVCAGDDGVCELNNAFAMWNEMVEAIEEYEREVENSNLKPLLVDPLFVRLGCRR